jgi:glycosyltransferase involved in cell wall biosynthesis
MPTNEIAARIAPSRQPVSAVATITMTARIQMLMPSLKIIPQKMHDENDTRRLKTGRQPLSCPRVKISVIVPAFNEEKLLGASLAEIKSAAAAFLARGWRFEIVVCDNNSTDRTADIARAAGAEVVFEPVNQIARARNTGAASATGDWLVFVDADTHPNTELFAEVAEQIISGKCLAGGVTIRLDEKHFVAGLVTELWNGVSRWRKLLAGSFIFVEAGAFRHIGGFSQELFAAEELELSQRLKKFARTLGRKIVILHRHPIKTSARKMRLYTMREHLRLLGRVLFNRRTLASREACTLWYDGRR